MLVRRFESGFSRQHLHKRSERVVVAVAGVGVGVGGVVVGGVAVGGQAGVGLFWLEGLQLCSFGEF